MQKAEKDSNHLIKKSSRGRKLTGIIGTLLWVISELFYFSFGSIFPELSFSGPLAKGYFYLGLYLLNFLGFFGLIFLLPLDFKWKDLKIKKPSNSLGFLIKAILLIIVAEYVIGWFFAHLFYEGIVTYPEEDLVQYPKILYYIFVLIFAPVLEETYYRVAIIEFGGRFLKRKILYVISAIFFALGHASYGIGHFFTTLIIALLLTILRELDDSILPCIITHFLMNLIVVLFPLYPDFSFL